MKKKHDIIEGEREREKARLLANNSLNNFQN